MVDRTDVLQLVISHFGSQRRGQWPDSKGEYWTECPFRQHEHEGGFSFSERGYKCFKCSMAGGLHKLAEFLGLIDGHQPRVPVRLLERPTHVPTPISDFAWMHLDPLKAFRPIPREGRAYLDRRHLSAVTVERWKIGWGVLPNQKLCPHERLILPIYVNGKLAALRGRQASCECGVSVNRDGELNEKYKWLGPYGAKAQLFNQDALTKGQIVLVTEAPLSAVLAMQRWGDLFTAVAGTSGASTWRQEWTQRLVVAKPRLVCVFYDNDPAGTPNEREYAAAEAEWERLHPGKEMPVPNGVRVATELLKAGLKVKLHRWDSAAPRGADLGDVAVGG